MSSSPRPGPGQSLRGEPVAREAALWPEQGPRLSAPLASTLIFSLCAFHVFWLWLGSTFLSLVFVHKLSSIQSFIAPSLRPGNSET